KNLSASSVRQAIAATFPSKRFPHQARIMILSWWCRNFWTNSGKRLHRPLDRSDGWELWMASRCRRRLRPRRVESLNEELRHANETTCFDSDSFHPRPERVMGTGRTRHNHRPG